MKVTKEGKPAKRENEGDLEDERTKEERERGERETERGREGHESGTRGGREGMTREAKGGQRGEGEMRRTLGTKEWLWRTNSWVSESYAEGRQGATGGKDEEGAAEGDVILRNSAGS